MLSSNEASSQRGWSGNSPRITSTTGQQGLFIHAERNGKLVLDHRVNSHKLDEYQFMTIHFTAYYQVTVSLYSLHDLKMVYYGIFIHDYDYGK